MRYFFLRTFSFHASVYSGSSIDGELGNCSGSVTQSGLNTYVSTFLHFFFYPIDLVCLIPSPDTWFLGDRGHGIGGEQRRFIYAHSHMLVQHCTPPAKEGEPGILT